MSWQTFCALVRSDLYRYTGTTSGRDAVVQWLKNPGFTYSFWFRLCNFLRQSSPPLRILFPVACFFLKHAMYKYGISIPVGTKIGPGLCIRHFGGIVVHRDAVIGANCNISQNVTVGMTGRGERAGTPSLGDNVYLGAGSVVIGKLRIGNRSAIGANAVVTRDIPDGSVAVGVPAKVISQNGSEGLVERTDYPSVGGSQEG